MAGGTTRYQPKITPHTNRAGIIITSGFRCLWCCSAKAGITNAYSW